MAGLTDSDDFMAWLRALVWVALAAALVLCLTMAWYGVGRLHDVMFPPLRCVAAHDEFHQTDNGTLVRICDRYTR